MPPITPAAISATTGRTRRSRVTSVATITE